MNDLTEEEKRLLNDTYPNRENVQKGDLFAHQLEALRQLRAGAVYLEEKYPEDTPRILSLSPAVKFRQWAEIALEASDGKRYRLTVTPTGDGYDCADDYYSAFLRESYDRYLSDTMSTEERTVLSFTDFPVPAGAEVNGETTVEDLLAMTPPLGRITHLFIANADDRDAVAKVLESRVTEIGLYGTYTVYFAPSLEEDVLALEQNRTALDYRSFSCFDLK